MVPHFGSGRRKTYMTPARKTFQLRELLKGSRAPTRRNFSFLPARHEWQLDCTAARRGPAAGTAAGKTSCQLRCGLVEKSSEEARVTPNQVTAARILVAFAAVALFSFRAHLLVLHLAAVLLTFLAMALDGVDGYLARRRGLSTPFGAKFDILGDRVVENLFFICFAASGLISLWVPVVFFVRGALTDFVRAQSTHHRSDENWMLRTRWGQSLVASRTSRASYATLKCICFCYLGLLLSIRHLPQWARFGETATRGPLVIAQAITFLAVIFCIVRAIPVLWEARRYLRARAKTPKPAMVGVGR